MFRCFAPQPLQVQFGHAGAQARGKTETAMAKNAAMKAGSRDEQLSYGVMLGLDLLDLLDLVGSWHHCA